MNNFSVCCVCFIHVKNANSSHLTSIFDKGGKVASMMFYLTGIAPVEVNGLEPSLICNECADELKVANCLRKKIVEGQKFLRSKRQKLEVEWIAREKKAYNKNFPVSDFKLSQSMKNKIIKIYPHLRKKLSKENTSPKINLSSVVIKKPTSPPIINTVASLEPKKEKFVPFTSKLIKNIDVRQSVLKFECDSCDASFLSFFEFQEHNKTHTSKTR